MLALIGYVLRHFGQKVKRLKDLEIARVSSLKLLMAGLWIGQAFRLPCAVNLC